MLTSLHKEGKGLVEAKAKLELDSKTMTKHMAEINQLKQEIKKLREKNPSLQ